LKAQIHEWEARALLAEARIDAAKAREDAVKDLVDELEAQAEEWEAESTGWIGGGGNERQLWWTSLWGGLVLRMDGHGYGLFFYSPSYFFFFCVC
jgi:hypothetical protein